MKGITPVIAVILLLLVTIVLVGFSSGFFQRIFAQAGTGVDTQTQNVLDKASLTISIDNTAAQGVTVRNTGTKDINANTEVNVFVGGAKVACTWVPVTITPKTTSTCTWSGTPCSAGVALKVVAPGNEESKTC